MPEFPEESAEELYDAAPCGYLSARPDGTIVRVNQTLLTWSGYTREELVDRKRFQDLLTVGGRVYYETHLGPLLRMQGRVEQIQVDLLGRDGKASTPVLLNIASKLSAGQPQVLRATFFDISERKHYERELLAARRTAELQARAAQVSAEIGRVLTRQLDLPAQLRLCAEAIVEHLDAVAARVWLYADGRLQLEGCAGAGEPEGAESLKPEARARVVPAAREAEVARSKRPVLQNDPAQLQPGAEAWVRREGVAAFIGVPILLGDELLGVLSLHARSPFDAAMQTLISATAQELALGIARTRSERERDALLVQTRLQADELRASRELLDLTLRSIGDAVVTTDPALRITFMNAVAEELTGWKNGAALGLPLPDVFRIINEASRQAVENPAERALATGQIVGLANHTVLVRRDGSEVHIDDSAAPIRGRNGEIVGAVLVFHDVSAQRVASRALQQTRDQLRAVVQNAPVVLFSTDVNGRLLLSEGKGLAALGVKPGQHVGQSLFELYAHVPWICDLLRRALAGEAQVGEGEVYGVKVETHFVPTFDEHQQLTGAVGLSLDVTERHLHEETVRKTIEFEQQLIGIVSHDLRNPIAAILLGVSLLNTKAQSLDPASLRTLSRIQASAGRAQRLIRDLLDFTQARLGTGIPVYRAPQDLAGLVRQVADEVMAANAGPEISLEHSGNLQGEWDGDRLAQVFSNLLGNAVKYSPRGSKVQVILRDEGPSVAFEVHNRGPPIPAESMDSIFQPMQRATLKVDAGRSVGLGLFIVKEIVRAHSGRIQVTSDAERGTTFSVRLPRADPGSGGQQAG